MKYLYIILILFTCVFLEYVPELHKNGDTMTFPFSNLTISSWWYWYIVYKDLKMVLLAWALWVYGIPKKFSLIKLAGSIACTFITIVPIYFILFYSAPFPVLVFTIKVFASILVGIFIYKFNDRMWTRNDTRSRNS